MKADARQTLNAQVLKASWSRVLIAGLLLSCTALSGRADTAKGEDDKYHKAVDAAVDAGLEYLAKAQLADGSFEGMPKCNAVTALSIMAFLAHGYSPGLEPYGDTINRGIDSILGSQQPDGTLIGPGGGNMYSHNIATLMLSEVSGMVDTERQKRVDEVLSKALQVILAAQKVNKAEKQKGGWRYGPNSNDSDMSHSGWATGTRMPRKVRLIELRRRSAIGAARECFDEINDELLVRWRQPRPRGE